MNKKYGILILLLSMGALFAQDKPKVAVLNASLGENVPINASAIVGDSINEMFVRSPKFQVTDRSALASLQEEKMFQLSGEVSDSDAVDIGKTIGAQYICVSNVNVLGETYSVSARLIEVETAQVINQQTRRLRGGVEVLYDLADLVGGALTGLTVVNAGSSQTAEEPVQEEPVQEAAPVQKQEPVVQTQPDPVYTQPASSRNRPEPKSHFMISLMAPVFETTMIDSNGYGYLEQDSYLESKGATNVAVTDIGVDMQYLEPFARYGYISFGMTYAFQELTYDNNYSSFDQINFMTLEPYLGLGVIAAPVTFLDFYGGLTLGYTMFIWGDHWSDTNGLMEGGLAFGVELGSDLHLGNLGFTVRYRYSYVDPLSEDNVITNGGSDIGVGGFMIGIGSMK